MTQHTPGTLVVIENEEGWIVDTSHERPNADGALAYVTFLADAHLFAASPDLLVVCVAILARLDLEAREQGQDVPFICNAMRPQLRAAIAKARPDQPFATHRRRGARTGHTGWPRRRA